MTIADLVADRRAATPSAAAEQVVPDGSELRRQLRGAARQIGGAVARRLDDQARRVEDTARGLESAMESLLEARALRLARSMDKLEALSPLAALKRGYAVAQDADGPVVDVVDMKLTDVVKLIRGEKGTVVRLEVKPADGAGRKEIAITRAKIELKPLTDAQQQDALGRNVTADGGNGILGIKLIGGWLGGSRCFR